MFLYCSLWLCIPFLFHYMSWLGEWFDQLENFPSGFIAGGSNPGSDQCVVSPDDPFDDKIVSRMIPGKFTSIWFTLTLSCYSISLPAIFPCYCKLLDGTCNLRAESGGFFLTRWHYKVINHGNWSQVPRSVGSWWNGSPNVNTWK